MCGTVSAWRTTSGWTSDRSSTRDRPRCEEQRSHPPGAPCLRLVGEPAARMAAMRWQIRAFAPAADRLALEGLWAAAMPPAWPLLRAGIARLGEGLVAEADRGLVGFVAVDMAGSIPLILVAPAYQRRGIGTALLAAAVDCLRRGGSAGVTAGSGGRFYIWPGVPRDLPGAVRFFTSRGWQHSHDTLDLVTDLRRYRPPPGANERAGNRGITITQPVSGRPADVLAFEAATFPSWT